jgi:hypothetical protein
MLPPRLTCTFAWDCQTQRVSWFRRRLACVLLYVVRLIAKADRAQVMWISYRAKEGA